MCELGRHRVSIERLCACERREWVGGWVVDRAGAPVGSESKSLGTRLWGNAKRDVVVAPHENAHPPFGGCVVPVRHGEKGATFF